LESDVAVDRDADQPPASAIRRVNLTPWRGVTSHTTTLY